MSEQPFGAGIEKGLGDTNLARQRQPVAPTRTAGTGGTPIYGGFIQEVETDKDLRGRKRYTTFSTILANTTIVAAGVRYFLNLVSKPEWTFEAPEGSGAEGERIAEIVKDITKKTRTPWHRIIRRAAMYRFYGFSVQEWTAVLREDGNFGLLDVEVRPQSTIEKWDCDEQGRVRGMVQRSPQTQEEIYLPRIKTIYAVDDALSDSPEGLGLFRHIAESARRLSRYEQLEGYGFETDLRGIPVGRAPLARLNEKVKNGDMSEQERTTILSPMTTFLQNHIKNPKLSMLLDSMTYETSDDAERPSNAKLWDMELLKATSSSHADIARTIDRLERQIARVLGVEQLLLGDNGIGSFAMAKEKSHNFALIIDSTLQELIEVFEADFLDRLFELNGWDPALKPTIKTDKLQFRNIEDVAQTLAMMAQAGAILSPDDPAINAIRRIAGLPDAVVVEPAELTDLGSNLNTQGNEE